MRGVTSLGIETSNILLFLLTRLMRGVTISFRLSAETEAFLLTRLMRGVTEEQFDNL